MKDQLSPSLDRFAAELEHAIGRELTARRDRRLGRVLHARPRVLAGTTVGAAGAAAGLALLLSAAGTSPAFAVTRHRDGSYTVTLKSLSAIPAANERLAQMHARSRIFASGGRLSCSNSLPGSAGSKANSVRLPAGTSNRLAGSSGRGGAADSQRTARATTTIVCPGRPGNSEHSGSPSS